MRRSLPSAPRLRSETERPARASLYAYSEDIARSWAFDRKPKKQLNWLLKSVAGGQIWCMRDSHEATVTFGERVQVGDCIECRAAAAARIIVGDDAVLSDRAIIQSGKLVTIGKHAHIGKAVLIMDRNHHGIGTADEVIIRVSVGDHAVVGDFSVLLPGATISERGSVPALAVVTRLRVISSSVLTRVMSVEYELALRWKLATLQSCQVLPQEINEEKAIIDRCRSHESSPVRTRSPVLNLPQPEECSAEYFSNTELEPRISRAANLRLVQAYGNLQNIELSKGCQFYCKPWGAPLLVAVDKFHVSIDSDTFVHNSTQLLATGNSSTTYSPLTPICLSGGSITLGRNCSVSWRTALITELHAKTDETEPLRGSIILEDQVWVGAMALILPNTHLGKGCVVAASAVVQGTFPPFTVIAGNPASIKSTIDPFAGSHGYAR